MMRVLIVLCLFFSVTAHAQSSVQDKKAARLLYQQAQHRAAQGDYEQALSLLDEAFIKYPSAGILYAIGIVYEKQGRAKQALEYYQRALDKKEPSDSLREKIENSQRKLENQMRPEIEVSDKTSPKEEEKWLSDSGLFLQGGLLSNLLLPSGGVWPFAAGGYLFDFGLFVKGEVLAPFATASLSVGWELLDGVLRPFPWFQAGYAFVRSLKDDTSGGWVMSMGAGLRWLPWSENGFWFGARAGIAFDLERERKSYPVPVSLSVGYSL